MCSSLPADVFTDGWQQVQRVVLAFPEGETWDALLSARIRGVMLIVLASTCRPGARCRQSLVNRHFCVWRAA